MKSLSAYIAAVFFISASAIAVDTPFSATGASGPVQERSPFALADQVVINDRSMTINGSKLSYDIRAGALNVIGKSDKETANISFIAYFAHPESSEPSQRPLAFCFNGGPGSSSVWLHMGFLGPKTVDVTGLTYPSGPVGYKDNPQTLLSSCDLVFIDPVSTGFSTAVNKDDAKKFHGVEEDLYSVADFIRLFLTKYDRWESPKLLIGESYGTLRAVGLAHLLQDRYFIDVNGLILISSVLNFQALSDTPSDDLASITALPSLAVIAQYHKQLNPTLAVLSVPDLIKTARKFAIEEYAPALLHGSALPADRRARVQKIISELTSLSEETVTNADLRITCPIFTSEFLKGHRQSIGRFDGRALSPRILEEPSVCNSHYGNCAGNPDPSLYSVAAALTSAFQTYISEDLQWKKAEPYVVCSDNVHPWNWSTTSCQIPGMGYLSLVQDFRLAMVKNPTMKVFVAAGYYDLATPYFTQEYSLTHLLLPKGLLNNVTFKGYEGGHMIYLDPQARPILAADLAEFVKNSQPNSFRKMGVMLA